MARAYFPLIQPPLWGRGLLTKHVDLFTCVCCASPALEEHGYDLVEDSRPIKGQHFPDWPHLMKLIIAITGTRVTEKHHGWGTASVRSWHVMAMPWGRKEEGGFRMR